MKIDPYNHRERYHKWRESVREGIPYLNKYNSDLVLRYLDNMEHGINVAQGHAKGGRSYIRLNTLREKMKFYALRFKERFGIDKITDISEEQICMFYSEMRKGVLKRNDGKIYKSTSYSVKCFKAFWHWWMKINRKEGKIISDITIDLDTREDKPKWVYLSEDQVKKLCENSKYYYKVLITFLFDTGIRAPTELMNIKVSDLYSNCKELMIRDEVSKTFGRRIKLMLSSSLLKEYINLNELSRDDFLFQKSPEAMNKYLKRNGKRLFGEKESLAGERYSNLTLYDFRHISCCYWLPRYKSESALKFRFGWKKSDKIHYYSEMLGMRDTISDEDMLVDITKTEIEKKLKKVENEKIMLQERVEHLENQMKDILDLVNKGANKIQKNIYICENKD